MVSTRTIYRRKRVEIIKEIVLILISLLTLEKQQLEIIPLVFFKRIKKEIENYVPK